MEKAQIIVYPAIFSPENNTYNVTFPDVAEAITFGEDIPEAVIMAQSALGLALYEQTQIPPASSPKDIHLKSDEDFVVMISLDLNEYRRKNHAKIVRKNTSIPEWLNILAEKENINFSQTLTDALKQKLGV
ncbi:type II toxin-antitoxin system HicB family antitoxin [Enterococcus cecorum]|uniref:type II toxin-antitoxin system HicB family antitoxin n=1 Tax=Enterococcus cecorum TaxID=44008 RepID=UPI0022DA143F|nr:type II toxin-antitoxin system HicB family antitoxin [Enterococcus cecorum]MDZ5440333.1 type II toxin-antitoxin system HicB family antitoxin [Enterococcus cecorum]MDZ5498420.1 type II toxin-antitoxin system HicB family antitoxin [Enterococcus cecorum]MDZ5500396.1 type II toxin-antitoxin system HicB family antitoxin [Enterococcus cecorum]MDZ5503849.1 type II toxin-antitoxin system HicB family antitoxin [Enterococcus cecorum]MDZ5531376.1 type II toxin-antitoxin system HicB family antitoxin [E